MKDEKVRITLKKQLLSSEIKEREEKKKHKYRLITLFIVVLLIGTEVGFLVGFNFNKPKLISTFSKEDTIKELIKANWLYANDYDDLDSILDDMAYYGMTYYENDPYTTYQSNEEMNSFASSINMDFVGIGVTYLKFDDYISVERVLIDSPAQKAGIIAGDMIYEIDKIKIQGLSEEKIKELVMGEKDTYVLLGIERQGEKLDLEVKRGQVDNTCYAYEYKNHVVLDLNSFGLNTYNEIIKYLDNYTNHDSLIIDLRSNSGGYQTALENIAGLFLDNGVVIMDEVDKEGKSIKSYANADKHYTNFKKIVILTNTETASASEVLTLALLENFDGAVSVGTKTYGKGVVQTTYPLSDGSAIKLTKFKWLSSKGVWINNEGIKPTHEVKQDDVMYARFIPMDENLSLTYDSVNEYVRLSALALKYLDYNVERIDGLFDQSFKTALNSFKTDYNLEADGILDKDCYDIIISALKREINSNKEKDIQLNYAIDLLNK